MDITHDEPPGRDWIMALSPRGAQLPSDRKALLEVWRKEWGNDTRFTRWVQIHPATNIAGLYWRYAE